MLVFGSTSGKQSFKYKLVNYFVGIIIPVIFVYEWNSNTDYLTMCLLDDYLKHITVHQTTCTAPSENLQ